MAGQSTEELTKEIMLLLNLLRFYPSNRQTFNLDGLLDATQWCNTLQLARFG